MLKVLPEFHELLGKGKGACFDFKQEMAQI